MNNKKRVHFFATLFLLIGLIFVPHFTPANATASLISFQIAIPKPAFDLSKLEVRDNQNRLVTSPVAKVQLEFLFVQSLNRMLMNNLTPGQVEKLRAFSIVWKTFLQLTRMALATMQTFAGYIQQFRKKIFSVMTRWLLPIISPSLSVRDWRGFESNTQISDALSSTVLRR